MWWGRRKKKGEGAWVVGKKKMESGAYVYGGKKGGVKKKEKKKKFEREKTKLVLFVCSLCLVQNVEL